MPQRILNVENIKPGSSLKKWPVCRKQEDNVSRQGNGVLLFSFSVLVSFSWLSQNNQGKQLKKEKVNFGSQSHRC
jgi:hypothetical protein